MSKLEIITTSDGSHSLLNTELNETYHSVHGAIQESAHVFIKNGLDFFCERGQVSSVKILEVGFGTGLNALLTLQRTSIINLTVHYTALEAFPLKEDVWSKLNYSDSNKAKEYFTNLHQAEWSKEKVILPGFTLLKIKDELQKAALPASFFDIIYFDAFAPNKQPEMWDISVLQKIAEAIKANGVFVTYCAKGQLKRDLREIGLAVETLQGPPGKKEMTRAIKSP